MQIVRVTCCEQGECVLINTRGMRNNVWLMVECTGQLWKPRKLSLQYYYLACEALASTGGTAFLATDKRSIKNIGVPARGFTACCSRSSSPVLRLPKFTVRHSTVSLHLHFLRCSLSAGSLQVQRCRRKGTLSTEEASENVP